MNDLVQEATLAMLRPKTRVHIADNPLRSIHGKRIMVTGAGGSIGSELVLQLAAHEPAHITMVDQSELGLYEINRRMVESGSRATFFPAIMDIRHTWFVKRLITKERPDIVFHAAALKHVPLLENDHNLIEAVRTNVMGSYEVAQACIDQGARMVMVSTDKAVNPASVMGLTKRLAELVLTGLTISKLPHKHSLFPLSIVRFGNVLGSSGSVIPLFMRQIQQGGPVTVTHAEMTRYFMTIKQACDLTLKTAEHGCWPWLYILDMGKPVKILDLAQNLIEMNGLRVEDVGIEFTGLRPGEKLHEELSYPWETIQEISPGFGVLGGYVSPKGAVNKDDYAQIRWLAEHGNIMDLKRLLVKLVPEFTGGEVWA